VASQLEHVEVPMSGSDPSVNRGPGGGGGDGDEDCPGKPFETVLASPDPGVVEQLTDDELLSVVAVEQPVRGVVAETLSGERVGAIVKDIVRLRRCMAKGAIYEADVVSVNGGAVTVRVRPT
jgi:hypothetical protein